MNAGTQAFAASIVEMSARRSSFTSRSCNVPNARSTRPFACGLLAQMMSMFSSDSTRPNCDRRRVDVEGPGHGTDRFPVSDEFPGQFLLVWAHFPWPAKGNTARL